jgi:hypothetical protein
MLMVGDPCYFVGPEAEIHSRCDSWKTACDQVFCKPGLERDTPMDVFGLGVAVATTHGDGAYPVFLEKSPDGRRRLVVELD